MRWEARAYSPLASLGGVVHDLRTEAERLLHLMENNKNATLLLAKIYKDIFEDPRKAKPLCENLCKEVHWSMVSYILREIKEVTKRGVFFHYMTFANEFLIDFLPAYDQWPLPQNYPATVPYQKIIQLIKEVLNHRNLSLLEIRCMYRSYALIGNIWMENNAYVNAETAYKCADTFYHMLDHEDTFLENALKDDYDIDDLRQIIKDSCNYEDFLQHWKFADTVLGRPQNI